jgi:hypothetical protein
MLWGIRVKFLGVFRVVFFVGFGVGVFLGFWLKIA